MRIVLPLLATMALAGCGILPQIGPGDPPPRLTTLSSTAPAVAPGARSGERTEAVSFAAPVLPQALATTRIAAIEGGTAVAYIQDLLLVDTPDSLFQALVSETVYRQTNLLVIDPRQATSASALRVTGRLYRFDFDVDRQEVVVAYEATWQRGEYVASRRFEAREPAQPYANWIEPALNRAANRVASDVAVWIRSS